MKLDISLAPAPNPVSADRIQLQQVLVNLIANATLAMDAPPEKALRLETT